MDYPRTDTALGGSQLRAQLVAQDFLVPSGVDGVFGYGEQMIEALDATARAIVDGWGDPELRSVEFPAVTSRAIIERSGYPALFPHLVGAIDALPAALAPVAPADPTEPDPGGAPTADPGWSDLLAATEYVLAPAACYSVYPLYSGCLPEHGASVRVIGHCFRHEPSTDPERLVSFRQLEFIRIGAPGAVSAWFDAGRARMVEVGRQLGLDVDAAPASDPFFGPARRVRSAMQVNDGAKVELRAAVGGRAGVAIASSNRHRDHLAARFGIRAADGATAHTACVAFGLERVVFAVVSRYGTDRRDWPLALRIAADSSAARAGAARMNDEPVSSRVRAVLAARSRLVGVTQLGEYADLFEAGLDSMGAVNVILGLEEEFDFVIPDDRLSRESTSSVAKLVDLVSSVAVLDRR